MFSAFDERMMRRAIELAELGRYSTHPNPRVGCVITRGERVVGEGWHRKWGEAHAEVRALEAAAEAARGATAYVTLEPHSFQGRTPPCTDALIRAGVARVVCGALDPNPRVQGEGVRQLRAAGIEVRVGLLENEVRALNAGFERRMTTGWPRVTVKIAASLDGRVALADGSSRWITGEPARADVQRLRAQASAVLTGVQTVLADDPRLDVRDATLERLERQPLRVVLDTRLRMPPSARMLSLPGETLVFTAGDPATPGQGMPGRAVAADAERIERLQRAGAEVVGVPAGEDGRPALDGVLVELGRRQCNDVLVEAGPTLAGAILRLGLAQELVVYLAPMLLGPQARAMAELPALERLDQASRYSIEDLQRVGADVKLRLVRRAGAPQA